MQLTGPSPVPEDDSGRRSGASQNNSDPSALETVGAPAGRFLFSSVDSHSLAVLSRRYDILGEAGRGAMGQVYKARDRETGETVALKILKPEIASDPAMIERFKSELLFARRITHKNVCRVHEFNRADGVAFTSMEFVEGESLRSVLKRFGSLTQRKGGDIALQICSGLKEAHAQGIVHRDLKPENVMIDTNGNVKIMDFGIARSMEALTLTTGALIGTPAYMAPEQAAGKPVDHRADIYALGLMLYEMFTGAQAFCGENAISVALKQMNEAPAPPRHIEPSVSPALERVILSCLEKDPDKRFQSVAGLESALLSSALPGVGPPQTAATVKSVLPVAVAPEPAPSAAAGRRQSARTPRVAAVLLIVCLALAAGVVWRHFSIGSAKTSQPGDTRVISPSGAIDLPRNAVTTKETETPKPSASSEGKSLKAPSSVASNRQSVVSSAGLDRSKARGAQSPEPRELAQSSSGAIALPSASAAGAGPPVAAAAAPQDAAANEVVPEPARPAGNAGGYVWVNRFPRQGGAQNAAKKIEEMGLPVTIVPRRNPVNNADFFVVLSGPFPAAKIDTIVQQLRSNGFTLARINRAAAAANKTAPASPN